MIPRWFNPLPLISIDRDNVSETIGKELTDKEWWLIREWTVHITYCFYRVSGMALEDNEWSDYIMDLELDVEKVNPSPHSSKN